jgi:ABC-2 type transport system ATP-binding protein
MTLPPGPRHAEANAPTYAIRTSGLQKTYKRGRIVAVGGLDLNVPLGGVHGFLGPNGSGKTTTIRMLLGLVHPDGGTMEVLGHPVSAQLPQIINSVGAIVESPKFFPNFSGRKNLTILAQAIGVPTRRVAEVLVEVGLGGREKDAFRTYSLGMKQRLAIAATLLKDPQLLIFDEPTNGLDPAGIREIRDVMRNLGDAGKTVLVSSHILSEVQQIADTATIIGRGRTLAEGPVDAILARGHQSVRVGIADRDRAGGVLANAGYRVTATSPETLRVERPDAVLDPAAVARVLGQNDLWPFELSLIADSLEDVFMALTTAGQPDRPAIPPAPFGAATTPQGGAA